MRYTGHAVARLAVMASRRPPERRVQCFGLDSRSPAPAEKIRVKVGTAGGRRSGTALLGLQRRIASVAGSLCVLALGGAFSVG